MVDEDESEDLSFGLEGKVTVATGGAGGIGAARCRESTAREAAHSWMIGLRGPNAH